MTGHFVLKILAILNIILKSVVTCKEPAFIDVCACNMTDLEYAKTEITLNMAF